MPRKRLTQRKLWPQEWTDYLTSHYATKTAEAIGEHLGLSKKAVQAKVKRMNLKKPADPLGMTPQRRYKLRLIAKGLCPRCGAPAAPYYLCERHREIVRARIVDGKPRKFTSQPRRNVITPSGILTRFGHITTHRMLG